MHQRQPGLCLGHNKYKNCVHAQSPDSVYDFENVHCRIRSVQKRNHVRRKTGENQRERFSDFPCLHKLEIIATEAERLLKAAHRKGTELISNSPRVSRLGDFRQRLKLLFGQLHRHLV